jgi:hypothetical protein
MPTLREAGPYVLQGYEWDAGVNRYRSDETGRFVARQRITELLERSTAERETRLRSGVQAMLDGRISENTWYVRTANMLSRDHLQHAALAAGGWDRLTPADRAGIAQRLSEQFTYLRDLGKEVTAGTVSDAQALARMDMYVGDSRAEFYEIERAHLPAAPEGETTIEIRDLGEPYRHCPECLAYHSRGWQYAGDLPLPTEQCSCQGNCRCELRRQAVPTSQAAGWIGHRGGPGDEMADAGFAEYSDDQPRDESGRWSDAGGGGGGADDDTPEGILRRMDAITDAATHRPRQNTVFVGEGDFHDPDDYAALKAVYDGVAARIGKEPKTFAVRLPKAAAARTNAKTVTFNRREEGKWVGGVDNLTDIRMDGLVGEVFNGDTRYDLRYTTEYHWDLRNSYLTITRASGDEGRASRRSYEDEEELYRLTLAYDDALARSLHAEAEWDPDLHPRDETGKFSDAGGGGGGSPSVQARRSAVVGQSERVASHLANVGLNAAANVEREADALAARVGVDRATLDAAADEVELGDLSVTIVTRGKFLADNLEAGGLPSYWHLENKPTYGRRAGYEAQRTAAEQEMGVDGMNPVYGYVHSTDHPYRINDVFGDVRVTMPLAAIRDHCTFTANDSFVDRQFVDTDHVERLLQYEVAASRIANAGPIERGWQTEWDVTTTPYVEAQLFTNDSGMFPFVADARISTTLEAKGYRAMRTAAQAARVPIRRGNLGVWE